LTEWAPLVRLKLGVDSLDLTDDMLNNTILIELSEKKVKAKLVDWATLFVTDPIPIKMAAICYMASEYCDLCEQIIFISESVGQIFSSTRQRTDWQQKKVDLMAEAVAKLVELDDTITQYPNPIVIISPATPLFATIEDSEITA
jgi:hypothetical protein